MQRFGVLALTSGTRPEHNRPESPNRRSAAHRPTR